MTTSPLAPGVLRVTRSGGFAGRTVAGELDLASADQRADRARALVDSLDEAPDAPDPAAAPDGVTPSGDPASVQVIPDGYLYTVEFEGRQWQAADPFVDDNVRELADLVLDGAV